MGDIQMNYGKLGSIARDTLYLALLGAALLVVGVACGEKKKTLKGVDMEQKVLTIGYLDAVTGPAAAIGKPFAHGKEILAKQVNAGGSGILPEGWTIEMVSRDHGYNPQKSVELYKEIKDRVLFIGTSFGTPNTLPLRPLLEQDRIVAFPASLSSAMSANEFTPPLGTSYKLEAMRAMDWVVKEAGGADQVKAGIVYQNDDYGKDGLAGWKQSADALGVKIVSEQSAAPGQKDFIAVITALKQAGATHVLLSVLPSSTGPILGTALQAGYAPVWVGNTPTWVDAFFKPEVIPPAVFANYYFAYSLPYWGENFNGSQDFLAAYEKFGDQPRDYYILLSYVQGLTQLKAFEVALKNGDVSREGYLEALHSLDSEDIGGVIADLDLSTVPYATSVQSRILKPDFANQSWKVVADYAAPSSL
jgi:ABC-type branched-subunit amino acid transport system substrate-binding protein